MGILEKYQQIATPDKQKREEDEFEGNIHLMTENPNLILELARALEEKGITVRRKGNFLWYSGADFDVGKFTAEFLGGRP